MMPNGQATGLSLINWPRNISMKRKKEKIEVNSSVSDVR